MNLLAENVVLVKVGGMFVFAPSVEPTSIHWHEAEMASAKLNKQLLMPSLNEMSA